MTVQAQDTPRIDARAADHPGSPSGRTASGPTARPAPAARRRLHGLTAPVLTTALVLGVAELLSRLEVVPPEYFPPVSEVARRLLELAGELAFWQALGQTVGQALTGLGLAVCFAVPLGLLTGLSRTADDLTAYAVELLRPVPSVALIPLAILVVGTGRELAVVLAAFASAWPLLLQTRYGLHEVDPTVMDTARVYGLPWYGRLRWILLPSAAGHIATGLRLSASLAIILAITAELIAGSPGLGRGISLAQSAGDEVTMYAHVVATGLLGVVVSLGLLAAERRVLAWHPSHRREVAG